MKLRLFILLVTLVICYVSIGQYSNGPAPEYDNKTAQKLIVYYSDSSENLFLRELTARFQLKELTKKCKTQAEIALTVCNWVSRQWNQDGGTLPKKSTAIEILEEAKAGKQFRCVEYSITIAGCLNALGIKSRTVGLKMKGMDTIQYGAGHVITEAFLSDLGKWISLDGQFDMMPVLNNIPLNAIELQQALRNEPERLQFMSISQKFSKEAYIKWINPYLYYFDIEVDNREGYDLEKRTHRKGIMLVPIGEKCPTIFQRLYPMEYVCTNSIQAFYKVPEK